MKALRYTYLLIITIMCLSLLSCGAKNKVKPELTVESYAELQTVLKMPPVYVPGGNWTEADIPGALWLGAKQVSFPATFKSLGAKFSINPEAATNTITSDGIVSAVLLYDGCWCGDIVLSDCASLAGYPDGKIREIVFKDHQNSDLPAPAIFPVSFNGVTIGTPAADFKEKTGLELSETGTEISTLRHLIRFNGSAASGVTSIYLASIS